MLCYFVQWSITDIDTTHHSYHWAMTNQFKYQWHVCVYRKHQMCQKKKTHTHTQCWRSIYSKSKLLLVSVVLIIFIDCRQRWFDTFLTCYVLFSFYFIIRNWKFKTWFGLALIWLCCVRRLTKPSISEKYWTVRFLHTHKHCWKKKSRIRWKSLRFRSFPLIDELNIFFHLL